MTPTSLLLKPMLAETATPEHAERLITNDSWLAQQKADGQRALVTVDNGVVACLNRQGVPKTSMVPPGLIREFATLTTGEWCFDGEILDGVMWLFDLPLAGSDVTPDSDLRFRLQVLEGFYNAVFAGSRLIRLLPYAETTAEKQDLLNRARSSRYEGLMLKRWSDDPAMPIKYDSGRRSRHLLKYKFVKTADCVVLKANFGGKENMSLGVYKNGQVVNVGDCTSRAGDGARVKVGDVVEVKYLYVGAGGRLYQPTFPKIRTDKAPRECTWDQLVHVQKGILL